MLFRSYLTIATLGNAEDFGNLTQARRGSAAVSSATRGVVAGGRTPTIQNIIDYVTIASTGNAKDFGDIIGKAGECSSMQPAASPTRGVFAGGTGPTSQKGISYITIASLGNDQDFGDLSSATNGVGGCSNSTRAIFRIREKALVETIQIATRGNATSFGSGPSSIHGSWANSPTRGVFGTYINSPSPTALADIRYISLQTGGDSIDFGDLSEARRQRNGGCSNAHGGLG